MAGAERGLTGRALRSMAWTGGGVAAEVALQALVLAVLARLLTPADFGVVSIALVVIGFAGIFGELGLNQAVIQRQALEPAHVRTAFVASLVLALALAGALAAASPWVARFFGAPAVAPLMAALALSLPIKGWSSVPAALLQRSMRFRDLSLANVLSYAAGFGLVGIPLAAAGLGAWSLAAAHLVQVTAFGVAVHLAAPVSHRLGVDRGALRDLLAFGGGVSVARVANYLALRGDNAVVGHVLGATALGLYGPAYHLMALPADLFQKVVQTVLFPAVSRLQGERERLAAVYRRGLAVTALLVLPGTVLAIALAPAAVETLLGARWQGVTAPLQVLAAGMFFRVGYKMSVVVVKASGAVQQFALRQVPYPLLVLSLSWLGTRWGLTGVAAGVVAALGVHYLLITALGMRVAGLSLRDYLGAHRPALLLAGAVLAEVSIATSGARSLDLPSWATLLLAGTATAVTVAALVRWMPARVLGADGLWLGEALAACLPGAGLRLRPVARPS